MKKNLLLFIFISLFLGFTACSDDDKDDLAIAQDALPENARFFVAEYFPESTYESIIRLKDVEEATGKKYEVKLSEGATADFDVEGYWVKVSSGKTLPQSLLNSIVKNENVSEIKKQYPKAFINELEKVDYNIRVGLNVGIDYALFYAEDGLTLGLDLTKSVDELPSKLQSFVSTHFDNSSYKNVFEVVKDDDISYHVLLKNSVNVLFDSEGIWYNINGGNQALPKTIFNEIPQKVNDLLIAKYNDAQLYSVVKYPAYYVFGIGNNKNVAVDPDHGVFEAPTDEVLKFVRAHFSESNSVNIVNTLQHDPQKIMYNFVVTVEDYCIKMNVDRYGEWWILQLFGADAKTKKMIPQSVLETLPKGITKYLSANYADKTVWAINKADDNILIGVDTDTILHFTPKGDFIGIQE